MTHTKKKKKLKKFWPKSLIAMTRGELSNFFFLKGSLLYFHTANFFEAPRIALQIVLIRFCQ